MGNMAPERSLRSTLTRMDRMSSIGLWKEESCECMYFYLKSEKKLNIILIEGETEVGAMANQDPTKDAAKENGAGSGSNYWF